MLNILVVSCSLHIAYKRYTIKKYKGYGFLEKSKSISNIFAYDNGGIV